MALKITPIPAFNDNYIWAIQDGGTEVVIVDPGDAAPVKTWLARQQLTLGAILITHHHADHTGGIAGLLEMTRVPVYGPAASHVKHISHPLKDGDQVNVLNHVFQIIATPGHTLDHIVFFHPGSADATEPPLLFCGDTLFAGGCGRIFEGNPQMMYTSLQRLAGLPASTLVFCAHEYTLSNLAFAAGAEPDNNAVTERQAIERRKREQQCPTLPSTILLEQRTNPFLRCHSPSLQSTVRQRWSQTTETGLNTEIEIFTALRRLKDQA